uniref:Uncharacterized protein n=1 Tax=Opuntia streptacantha TaxID=393608 RepID=A0A7C8YXR5_OPUST
MHQAEVSEHICIQQDQYQNTQEPLDKPAQLSCILSYIVLQHLDQPAPAYLLFQQHRSLVSNQLLPSSNYTRSQQSQLSDTPRSSLERSELPFCEPERLLLMQASHKLGT